MRKLLFVFVAALAVAVAGIAYAQDAADSVTVTSNAAKGGTKKKPKPLAPDFEAIIGGAVEGERAATPLSHDWKWTGVREMGQYFPTCTAAEIDAAQSDAACPKGSLVAEGDIVAKLGPAGNRASNFPCTKELRYYNEGKGEMNLFAVGPAAECGNVGYLSPIVIKWVKEGNASEQRFVFPDNIREPLPGVEGGFAEIRVKFKNLTKKVKLPGKKRKVRIGYLTSFGCGKAKNRTFTFESKPVTGEPKVVEANAGTC